MHFLENCVIIDFLGVVFLNINYTLTRSHRKTVAIHIRNGTVEVRAPISMPRQSIDRFVMSKEAWITKNLAHSSERLEKKSGFSLDYGGLLTYRGKQCPIEARQSGHIGFDDEKKCFYLPPDLHPEQIKHCCIEIYKMLAKRDLTAKVKVFSEEMKLVPTAVKVNSAKTRWGSCSSRHSVNFSWMVVMADDAVSDYVVVHELAHIAEMNHSPRFWAIVARHIPDYEQCKAQLKVLQMKLSEEDWGVAG